MMDTLDALTTENDMRPIAQQIQLALEEEGVSTAGWQRTQAIIESNASEIDEYAWDIFITIFEYLHSLKDMHFNDTLLQAICSTTSAFTAHINPRECVMLTSSRLSKARNIGVVMFCLQLLSTGLLALQKKRCIRTHIILDSLRTIQTVTYGCMDGLAMSHWRDEDICISLHAAIATAATVISTAGTITLRSDEECDPNLLPLHICATWLSLARVCIKFIWLRNLKLQPLLAHCIRELTRVEPAICSEEIYVRAMKAAHFGIPNGQSCENIVEVICQVCWWQGSASLTSKKGGSTEEPSILARDSEAEDEAEEAEGNPLFERLRISRAYVDTLRSALCYYLIFMWNAGHFESTIADICALKDVETVLFDSKVRDSSESLFVTFPAVFSAPYLFTLLGPSLHQLVSEHVVIASSMATAAEPEGAAAHEGRSLVIGILDNLERCLNGIPDDTLKLLNTSTLRHKRPTIDKKSHDGVSDEDPEQQDRSLPFEVHLLQSLLSAIVRDPNAESRKRLLSVVQQYFRCLQAWSLFFVVSFAVETCPIPSVTSFLLDSARRRTKGEILTTKHMTVHHLVRLAIICVEIRLRKGLFQPAAAVKAAKLLSNDAIANYLAENAEVDTSILAIIRTICLQYQAGAWKFHEDKGGLGFTALTPISKEHLLEFRDLFARPLMQKLQAIQQDVHARAGILDLHEHPAPFVPAGEPRVQRNEKLQSSDPRMSQLFLLEATLTRTLELLEETTAE